MPQKVWSLFVFPDQSQDLGSAIAQIASSVGRSEAPKVLSESCRRIRVLPQEKPTAVRFYGDFWISERLIILYKSMISDITRPNMLIPYSTTYLIHYFYNSKTRGDRQKRTSDFVS